MSSKSFTIDEDEAYAVTLLADAFLKYFGKVKVPKHLEPVFDNLQKKRINVVMVMDRLVRLMEKKT